jgi:hypothetical protein
MGNTCPTEVSVMAKTLSAGVVPKSDRDSTATPALDRDIVFGTLKNRRRREVLRFIRSEGGSTRLRELSEHIAAYENDIPVAQVTSKQRKRVYVSLYQVHLPSMDRDGVVDYNKARSTIELTEPATVLYQYLDGTEPVSPTGTHYFGLTTFGGLLYVFASILLGPGSLVATATVVCLLGALLALAVYDVGQAWPRDLDVVPEEAEEPTFGATTGAD